MILKPKYVSQLITWASPKDHFLYILNEGVFQVNCFYIVWRWVTRVHYNTIESNMPILPKGLNKPRQTNSAARGWTLNHDGFFLYNLQKRTTVRREYYAALLNKLNDEIKRKFLKVMVNFNHLLFQWIVHPTYSQNLSY